ncbi:TonB-dependent receptor [Sphingomonas cavernae]|uniref:TonB-dependent receptor n=1 Tax=Sphingomonas cavernae TaxID=2320861 RepID=A0A418WJI0_9SPHN|nr:TonB-dependent receptor [Sphingomonas cavernae]RJF90201.1 TonB-dependent receptor [Sphingomonas cavernae]
MRITLSALLLFAPAIAHAEGEIVVTGHGLDEAAGDAAYDIVTIGRDRLTTSASDRLEDVLRDVAGLQQFRRSDARSANPTSQGVTLRGLGGNASSRALVILDGVPQTDPFGGWISWPAFAPERLEQVRVTRGGGSGVAGPGALAGTIELTSAGPDRLAPYSLAAAYGSRDAVQADAALAAQLGQGFVTLSADYARGDGFIPIVSESRGSADRPAPYEQASVAARAVVPVSAQTELQANMLVFTDRRERGFAFSDNGSDGADASLRLVGRGDWGWSALGYVQLREFRSSFASINADRSAATQTSDQYNVPSTGLGARVEVRPPLGETVELRLGGDWRRADGVTREFFQYVAGKPTRGREAGGRTDTLGAFAEVSADLLDALTLTGGARIDHWWIADGFLRERQLSGAPITDTRFDDRQGWEPTARAGLAFNPATTVTLRTAAYLGWRLPTLNELYRPFRVGADATAANADLAPEHVSGVEAGIDWRPTANARLSATLFSNRLEDAIANVTIARGPGVFPGVGFVSAAGFYRQRQNLEAVKARGVELDAAFSIADFRLAASYAYTDSKVNAAGIALSLDGLRPAQTPEHMASATLGWQRSDDAGASLTLRYVSDQFEDDQNQLKLDDAFTVDARLTWPVANGLLIEARGENLANTRVEAARSQSGVIERATPRTLWIGLRYAGGS